MAKKNITITLEIKEIVYNLENKTHIVGRSIDATNGDQYAQASNVQADADADDADSSASYQIKRSICSAISEAKVELAEYLNEERTTADNKISGVVDRLGQVVLNLDMPSNYNEAATDSLGYGLNEYVTNRAIFDWFSMTNPQGAELYNKMAIAAMETTRRAMMKRVRPRRPSYATGSQGGL